MSRMVFDAPPSRPRAGRPVPPSCATPGCDELHADGSRFCDSCRSRLAVIREDFDMRTGRRWVQDSFGKARGAGAKKRPKGTPICTRFACYEPRESGHAFCVNCEADGWVEEES